MPDLDVGAMADEMVRVLGTGGALLPLAARTPGFDAATGYRVAADVRRRRERQGWRVVGRKLGFTNRRIWPDPPMWSEVYDRTVVDAAEATIALAPFSEPRIEPEVVVGLRAAPSPGREDGDLLGRLSWVAPGIEIVQSIYPDWIFTGPDAIAAGGLHGALIVGPRHVVARDLQRLRDDPACCEVDLSCDGRVADHGSAANVLDGPLDALAHLIRLLADDPAAPPLLAGEIVSTGTLTRALPVRPGETWTTSWAGIALAPMRVHFA